MNDNGDVTDYAPNALNQYESVAGSDVYYDEKFNLMWTGGFSAGYDAANHLTAISSGEDYGQFVYDGLGRCLKRTIDWETTIITYDDWSPIVEWDEWDNLSAWNVYGSGSDEILWRYSDRSGHLRYHSDRQGNVTALLDYNGNGLERYSYDAFGHPTITDWNSVTQRDFSWYWNRFLFKGREYFPQLGLYDVRARFYHPQLGRFLQKDPIGFGGGDANLFRYCGSDPVNASDPTGMYQVTLEPMLINGTPLSSDYPFGTSPQDFERMFGPTLGGANNAGPDDITAQILTGAGLATTHEASVLIPPLDEPEAVAADDISSSQTQYDIPGAINALEKAVPQYTAQFPQAPPAAPIVEALKQALNQGHIQVNGGLPWGGDAMRLFGGTIYIRPNLRGNSEFLAPRLAHEGEHMVDPTPKSSIVNEVHREQRGYLVEHNFSVVIPGMRVIPIPSDAFILDQVMRRHRK